MSTDVKALAAALNHSEAAVQETVTRLGVSALLQSISPQQSAAFRRERAKLHMLEALDDFPASPLAAVDQDGRKAAEKA